MRMADEEPEHDDMQLEGESSDDGGSSEDEGDATDTDIDGGEDETQVIAQDTEIAPDQDVARMMEEQDEDPGGSREAPPAEACGSVESDDGGRGGNEPTQATQIDSPQAPTQQDEDSENTESLNPAPLASRSPSASQAAGGTGARRTPSPLRRNGRGSGVFLSRVGAAGAAADAAAGDRGTSSGFLSSTEPSAKAARAPAASSLSPQPLPPGWLDDQPNADRAAANEGAQAQAKPKKRAQLQHAGKRASTAATTTTDDAAAVPQTLPKKPSPAKAAADSAGWIRTKGSPSKGKGRKAPPVAGAGAGADGDGDDEHATALDTQEGSMSQSILAIGVPPERRVLEPPRSRTTAAGGAAATAAGADEGEDDGDDDEEEMLAAGGATGGTVNSQELRANEFSQIRKGCSQEQDDFNRMMDDVIADAAADSGAADPLSGALDEDSPQHSPQQAEPRSQGSGGGSRDTGRGGSGKRKKMKSSRQVEAADGSAKTPRGGVSGRKGTAGSRTPGAYVGGVGAKSSTKKRAAPSHPDGAIPPTRGVFDMPSDDDGSDSGVAGGRSPAGRKAASKGVASPSRGKRNTEKKKITVPAAVSKAAQTARGRRSAKSGQRQQRQEEEEEEEDEEDCVVVDVRNMHGDDGDDSDDEDIVRTTQDVQMEKRMAAIRKDASSVSAPEEEKEEGEEEEEEEGRDDVEGEKREEEEHGGGGGGSAADEPSRASRRGRGPASGSKATTKAGSREKGRKSKPLSPELLTYKTMEPFLKSEGWEVVVGKGLATWFYLIPGKKGKNGKNDVDYVVSEKEVVEHVCNDKEALARYEVFRKKPAKAAGRPKGGGASSGAAATRAERGRPGQKGSGRGGRCRSSSGSTESAARRGKKAQCDTNAGSSATAETTAGSTPAEQASSRGEQGRGQARGQARGRRRAAERPPPPPSGRPSRHVGINWEQKWRVEWPKLRKEGWHWEYGKMGCIYVKDGFNKHTGTVGVHVFETRVSLLEHMFLQQSAAVPPGAGGDAGSSAGGAAGSSAGDAAGPAPRESTGEDGEGDAGNRTGGGEPVVEWGLAKNRVRRSAAHANSTAPEVMVLPGRGGGRKVARSPAASAAQGGETPSRQDDGQSAGQGGGSDRPAPRAQGGSKRGGGRGGASARVGRRRRAAGAAKQSPKETRGNARGDLGGDQRREMESGEDAVDDNHDDADNAATQPQFELSTAINLTRWGSSNPAASAAAAAASSSAAGKGATASKTPEAGLTRASSVAPSKLPGPANGSPTASNGGGGGGGGGGSGSGSGSGSDADGAADSTPKRKSSTSSPPSSSCDAQGDGGAKRRKQGSPPTAGNGVRSSNRRIIKGPLSGLGVVVTGLGGEARKALLDKIEKLGGEMVNIFGGTASVAEWRKWLLVEAALGCVGGRNRPSNADGGTFKSEVGAKPDSADTTRPRRRMIAVATPDSDRTPKFQLAMAAGMPIVHPLYVDACTLMATEVDTTGYLLPLGRSALLGRGLIMPSASPRHRPFQGKTVLLCMHGTDARKQALSNWVFTLSLAGATLKVLQEEGGGGGVAPGLGPENASWCTLESALYLLEKGEIFCVIGPKRGDGAAVPTSLAAVEDAAIQAGTPAGSLEWAIQCMAQGRFLLPDAGTCPWFPLGASGGSSGGEPRPFHVHVSSDGNGKRYVSGDYVFLTGGKGGASKRRGGAATAAATAAAAAVDAQVVRIISFRRDEAGGKVKVAIIPMKRGAGEKVLVASGAEADDEEEEKVVEEEVLGARALGMTSREMQATQCYSLKDSGVFMLSG